MNSPKPVLVFDMDGVLVEVSASYREAIRHTVAHFTGQWVEPGTIQEYKNQGGWNNDWKLAQRMCADLGQEIPYDDVVREFQRLFLGEGAVPGLIEREVWIPRPGLLERLAETHHLAIFTGRLLEEARITLDRCAPHLPFDPVVSDEDVPRPKPAPDGLQAIARRFPGADLLYFGDTVDDARSALSAGVPFIGISAQSNPGHAELSDLLAMTGAIRILENINDFAPEQAFA